MEEETNPVFMMNESTHQSLHKNVRIFNPDFGIWSYHTNGAKSYLVEPSKSRNQDNEEKIFQVNVGANQIE